MTPPRHIAVIDIGKTNAKLALVEAATLAELAVVTRPNRVLPGPPYPHADLDGHWRFLLDGLAAFHAAHGVDGISVTTHGAAAVLLDAAGGLAAPMLDYEHTGPDDLAAAYDALRPDFAQTGSPRLPMGLNLGAQLHWLLATQPGLRDRVASVLTYPQYWGFRLTGIRASDVCSLGCHTDLWNPETGDYSTLVDTLGIRPLMAPIRSAFDALGPVLPEIAETLGIFVPVYCGIHDSNASLLPHLLGRQPPFTVLSTGTWVIVLAVGGDASALDARRDGLCNVDAFGNPVPSARFMGGREFDLLTGGHPQKPTQDDIRAVIDGGVMVRPTFVPGCGPFPDGKGEWSTDPAPLPGGVRTAAVSLYLALVARAAMAVAGAAGPIIIEGPFGRDALFAEALQRLTNRQVAIASGTTGTSTGAAMLALGQGGRPNLPPDRPVGGIFDLSGLESYAERWAG